jgi:hypothetical protein
VPKLLVLPPQTPGFQTTSNQFQAAASTTSSPSPPRPPTTSGRTARCCLARPPRLPPRGAIRLRRKSLWSG